MNNCLNCGKGTSNPKFCSKSCSASYNNRMFPKRQPEGTCRDCSKPISSGRTYCSGCYFTDWTKVTYAQLVGRRAYQKHSQIRDVARRVYATLNRFKHCLVCKYSRHIEVCHIKGIAEFKETSLISEINSPKNLIGLCPNCHWELDHGLIKRTVLRQLLK